MYCVIFFLLWLHAPTRLRSFQLHLLKVSVHSVIVLVNYVGTHHHPTSSVETPLWLHRLTHTHSHTHTHTHTHTHLNTYKPANTHTQPHAQSTHLSMHGGHSLDVDSENTFVVVHPLHAGQLSLVHKTTALLWITNFAQNKTISNQSEHKRSNVQKQQGQKGHKF